MHSDDFEHDHQKTRAIDEALSRIGKPIPEAQARYVAALEDCECNEGMFALAATRRQLFGGAGVVAAVGMTTMLPGPPWPRRRPAPANILCRPIPPRNRAA